MLTPRSSRTASDGRMGASRALDEVGTASCVALCRRRGWLHLMHVLGMPAVRVVVIFSRHIFLVHLEQEIWCQPQGSPLRAAVANVQSWPRLDVASGSMPTARWSGRLPARVSGPRTADCPCGWGTQCDRHRFMRPLSSSSSWRLVGASHGAAKKVTEENIPPSTFGNRRRRLLPCIPQPHTTLNQTKHHVPVATCAPLSINTRARSPRSVFSSHSHRPSHALHFCTTMYHHRRRV